MKNKSKLIGQRGFSLVELLVVIAVIAIIAAIAIPNIANITTQATIAKSQRNAQNIASVASAAKAAGVTAALNTPAAATTLQTALTNATGMSFSVSPMSGPEITAAQAYLLENADVNGGVNYNPAGAAAAAPIVDPTTPLVTP